MTSSRLTLTPQLLARIQALGFDGTPSDALAWLVSCAEDHAETVRGFDVYRNYTTTALGIDPRSCPEDVAEAVATFRQVARLSAAWNDGASAQCAGLPRHAVPYLPDSEDGAAWLAGWTADAWSPGGRLHREMMEDAEKLLRSRNFHVAHLNEIRAVLSDPSRVVDGGFNSAGKVAAMARELQAVKAARDEARATAEEMRAEAADMQRAHAETLDYLFEQRDSLSKRVLNLVESREAAWADALRMADDGDRLHVELTQERARADALAKRVLVLEEDRDAWRRAANVAPVTQCGACGAALLPQPRDNGVYPCACGSVERVTTFATPSTALDVVRLKAELDTETRRHEAATTRLSAIHDVLLSSTGSSPAITDPPNVWRRFIDDLADLADDGKALPLFQRLVERTAAALGLDKERLDPETDEPYLPSWHDIPERVTKLREENANLLSKKEGT